MKRRRKRRRPRRRGLGREVAPRGGGTGTLAEGHHLHGGGGRMRPLAVR